MSEVMFGEDMEGEAYDPDLDRELEYQLIEYDRWRETQMAFTPTLTIMKVVPCTMNYDGEDRYDVHFNYSRNGEIGVDDYRCLTGVENCWHAKNRAVNEILNDYGRDRSNTLIVHAPGYDDAFTGKTTLPEYQPIELPPVVNETPLAPPYGLHLYLDGCMFDGPRFYDFFEATDKAEVLTMDHDVEIIVTRSGVDVAIVNTEGEVLIIP